MLKNLCRKFAEVTSHSQKGIPRVTDKLVWVNVIGPDGIKQVVAGYVGESMLYTLEKAKLDIPGTCRGGDFHIPETEDLLDPLRYGPTCAQCQIEVGEPWVHYLKNMGHWEKDKIVKTNTGFFTEHSRLACCLVIEKWMNGIEISIPFNEEQKMDTVDFSHERGINRIYKD